MEEKKLIPAPFDHKNACPEFDWLFDSGNTLANGRQCIGFIEDVPCVIEWSGHRATIRCMQPEKAMRVEESVAMSVSLDNKEQQDNGFVWKLNKGRNLVLSAWLVDE